MKENLNETQYFEKYYSRLRTEAWLKALLEGGLFSFGITLIAALVTWFTVGWGFFLAIGLLIPGTAAITACLYFFKYRPNTVKNARRLDSMGLEERLVTMVEYQNDESFMAKVQREDAKAALEKLSISDIKLNLGRKLLITVTVLLTLAFCMTVVSALSFFGVIPYGNELFTEIVEGDDAKRVKAEYSVRNDKQGYILGEANQYLYIGDDATVVIAIAKDGYTFDRWSDGIVTPARVDKNIASDISVSAIFTRVDDYLPEDDGEGDEPDDLPPKGQGMDSSSSSGGSGKYDAYNQVIDGNTDYRELIEIYKEDILDYLDKYGSEMTPEEREIIESYIGVV